MVAKKETKEVGFVLPKLKLAELEIPIMGDTELIVHAWSYKAKKEMLDKQMGNASAGREKKDPVRDFEDSLYRIEGGGYGFPSVGFKNAAVTACTSLAGMTKVAARQAFFVLSEQGWTVRAFDGEKMRQDLVRIEGSEPEMREDMVRVGMGTADLRYRASFWPWSAIVRVRFNANVLSAAQIVNLFNTAGFAVGIGEWRMEKDGQSGSFHVATLKEAAA
jgi:hypothetical protein